MAQGFPERFELCSFLYSAVFLSLLRRHSIYINYKFCVIITLFRLCILDSALLTTNFESWTTNYGLWALAYGLWITLFGYMDIESALCIADFEIWIMGYGLSHRRGFLKEVDVLCQRFPPFSGFKPKKRAKARGAAPGQALLHALIRSGWEIGPTAGPGGLPARMRALALRFGVGSRYSINRAKSPCSA